MAEAHSRLSSHHKKYQKIQCTEGNDQIFHLFTGCLICYSCCDHGQHQNLIDTEIVYDSGNDRKKREKYTAYQCKGKLSCAYILISCSFSLCISFFFIVSDIPQIQSQNQKTAQYRNNAGSAFQKYPYSHKRDTVSTPALIHIFLPQSRLRL